MPIAAMLPTLQNLIKGALTSDIAGSPSMLANTIAGAVATIAPSGLQGWWIFLAPLVPAGLPGAIPVMQNTAFIIDIAGSPDALASAISSAVALVCPTVPPTGVSIMQGLIAAAFKMDIAGSPDALAATIASAIIAYFTAGMVI
jgi:hypothetical protein